MRHPIRTLLLTVFATLATLGAGAAQAAPTTTLVEGVLASAGGGPVPDGKYAVTFSLYPAQSGGSAVWTEGPLEVQVTGGQFQHALGSQSSLGQPVLAALTTPWLGLKVATDAELPRAPVHATAFALRATVAEAVDCSGCIKAAHLDGAVLAPYAEAAKLAKVATSGQFADLAGLPEGGFAAAAALAKVATTGKYADLIGTPDLAAYAKVVDLAGYVTAEGLATVATTGQYADLKGTPVLPKVGAACGTGLVLRGFAANGALDCVPAFDPKALPADGLDEISNNLLKNQFTEVLAGSANLAIPDNNPLGVSDTVTVPDLGVVQKLTVTVQLSNSDVSKIKVTLIDPSSTSHVLYDGGTTGTKLVRTFPAPDAPLSGDLTAWVGKNAAGKWSLVVADTGFKNNATDGQIDKWSIDLQTLSTKKVAVEGDLVVSGTIGGNAGQFLVPSGAVMAFNLKACPTGWSELTAARGRYVVGLPQGGQLGLAVGTALSDGENRATGKHTHGINDPGHTHHFPQDYDTGPDGGSGPPNGEDGENNSNHSTKSATTGITIQAAGTVDGTNAPYLQLLMCQKN